MIKTLENFSFISFGQVNKTNFYGLIIVGVDPYLKTNLMEILEISIPSICHWLFVTKNEKVPEDSN